MHDTNLQRVHLHAQWCQTLSIKTTQKVPLRHVQDTLIVVTLVPPEGFAF